VKDLSEKKALPLSETKGVLTLPYKASMRYGNMCTYKYMHLSSSCSYHYCCGYIPLSIMIFNNQIPDETPSFYWLQVFLESIKHQTEWWPWLADNLLASSKLFGKSWAGHVWEKQRKLTDVEVAAFGDFFLASRSFRVHVSILALLFSTRSVTRCLCPSNLADRGL
jgi:hypothetical protein